MKSLVTKELQHTVGNFRFERTRNSEGAADITVIGFGKCILSFGNEKAGGSYKDSYEIAAREFAAGLEKICDDPCNLIVKEESNVE